MHRRLLLAAAPVLAAAPRLGRAQAAQDFGTYLAALQARARRDGIPDSVIQQTTGTLVPNADVLRLDQHQPEFSLTWAQYGHRVINPTRIAAGKAKAQSAHDLLAVVTNRYGVGAVPLLGIWGIETNYGTNQGDFDVIDALTTLAWNRNSSYFGGQVISAMRIVAAGYAPAQQLMGSYAGAMGQPQFMPSVYLSTAVSFTGNGQPDIWNSDGDALASMSNYLHRAGWISGLPASEPVTAPANIDPNLSDRDNMRTIAYWQGLGIIRAANAAPLGGNTPAALLLPDGPGGAAFLVYENFRVIRKYNASDYYALAVSGLGALAFGA